jgi:sortase A
MQDRTRNVKNMHLVKQADKKIIRILIFILSGVLVLTAAVVFLVLWNEGLIAEQNAQELLAQSNISLVESGEAYTQPDAPEAQTEKEISSLLETELKRYSVIVRLDIEKLNLSLPVLSETSAEALKISVCYYVGPEPGGEGNLVITGHNYRNGAHFGRLDELSEGDRVTVTDKKGNSYTYKSS